MVGTERTPRPKDDRAQLILIGAISLAFILLGVVVVFNSVQYTETVSSGETGETLANAEVTDTELKNGIDGIIRHHNPDTSSESLADIIENYIETEFQSAKANQRPVSVNFEDYTITSGSVGGGNDITVNVEYAYTTKNGEVTRTISVDAIVGDALP